MKMFTCIKNSMRDINDFVNAHAIPKERIVNIFQSNDGTYTLIYYAEE